MNGEDFGIMLVLLGWSLIIFALGGVADNLFINKSPELVVEYQFKENNCVKIRNASNSYLCEVKND